MISLIPKFSFDFINVSNISHTSSISICSHCFLLGVVGSGMGGEFVATFLAGELGELEDFHKFDMLSAPLALLLSRRLTL